MEETRKSRDLFIEEDPQVVAKLSALGGEIPVQDEQEERRLWRPKTRLERREARARIDEFVLSHENFTGEEYLGRYLDLHEFHLQYQNLHSSFAGTSYLEYLRTKIFDLPISLPDIDIQEYARYLAGLKTYLKEFERRALPLSALKADDEERSDENPFEAQLQKANSPADLEKSLSMADLKVALESRGLKASGTAAQRAFRLFAVKNLPPDQYPLEFLSTKPVKASGERSSDVKRDETYLKEMLNRLRPLLQATQAMINKKLTMTYEEIAQELREEEKDLEAVERSDDEDEEEDEEEKLKANGVIDPSTGKLIPKWKYRLYGLNQEFKCEICGDQTYFGRKAFEKHFQDYRHTNGMRSLGIPNTAHFHDITSIEDAKKLYEKLRRELDKIEFKSPNEEEFEDSQGNVLSKSAYEDLKREGLL